MNINKHSKGRAIGLSSSFALLALLGMAILCPSGSNEVNAATSDSKSFTVNFNVLSIRNEEQRKDFYVNFLVSQKISIGMDGLAAEIKGDNVQPVPGGKTVSSYDDFTVSTNSPNGLEVYVYGEGSDNALVGVDGTNKIPAISSAKALNDFENNTWGYSLAASTTAEGSLTYKPLATSMGANADYKSDGAANDTVRLSFGAKVDTATPADTYTKTVNVQVVPSGQTTALVNALSNQLENAPAAEDETQEGEEVEATQE